MNVQTLARLSGEAQEVVLAARRDLFIVERECLGLDEDITPRLSACRAYYAAAVDQANALRQLRAAATAYNTLKDAFWRYEI